MKNILISSIILVLGLCSNQLFGQDANQCIVTNTTDWTVATDTDGNPGTFDPGAFNMPPVLVPDGCLDPAIIACICPTGQILPNVGTCDAALEIWGEDFGCNNGIPCSYPPNSIFYFQTTFDFTDSCHVIDSFLVQVQADNFMDFRINGTTVLNTFGTGTCPNPVPGNVWNTTFATNTTACFNTNVTNALNLSGPNTITIQVQNAGGGCLNYAFLSLCAKFWTHEEQLDASFNIDPTPIMGGDLLSSISVNHPTLHHEWYFMDGPADAGPWNPVGVILGSFNFVNYFAADCIHHRVIHRVALNQGNDHIDDHCEACFEVIYHKCVGGVERPGDEKGEIAQRPLIDCAILDKYEWGVIGEFRLNNSSGTPDIQVHPIPVNDQLNINWNDLDAVRLIVLDINAKSVYAEQIKPSESSHKIDVSRLPSGTYFLKIETISGNSFTKNFVVIH